MGLVDDAADPLASAVDIARPRVGPCHLKSARKAAVDAPLHRMVGRVPLARTESSPADVWINTLSGRVQWIDERVRLIISRELVALRPDVRTIYYDSIRKLSLKTKRPALGVRAAKILVKKA